MLGDALSFPANSDDWLPTLIIGGVLTLLSPLILPSLVVYGYLARVMRRGAAGETRSPSFTDWGSLFGDGVMLFVVTLGYLLIALIPVVGAGFLLGVGTQLSGDASASTLASGLLGLGFTLVVVAVVLLLAYLLPAAYVNFVIEDGSLRSAFAVRTILRGAFTGKYAVAWVLGTVLAFVGSLLLVTIVGAVATFYAQVAAYYLYSRGFAEGLGSSGAAEPDPFAGPV